MKKFIALFCVLIFTALAVVVMYTVMKKTEDALYPILYFQDIKEASDEFFVPAYVILSVIKCESNFKPDAVSHAGAVGLMQILPETFEWLCLIENTEYDPELLYDEKTNIRYGTKLLGILYERYNGDWRAVHAAYNAGWGRVDRWIEEDTFDVIPFAETREYVKRIEKAKEIYRQKTNNS